MKHYLGAIAVALIVTERLIDKRGDIRERCPNNEREPVVGVWKRKWVQARGGAGGRRGTQRNDEAKR